MTAPLPLTRPVITGLIFLVVGLVAGCSQSMPVDQRAVDAGRALYVEGCQECHGEAATGQGALPNTPVHGPGGHTWHHDDGLLVDYVMGRFTFEGRTMPSFEDSLSESDVIDILAYIKTGWLPEQREAQARVTRDAQR